MLKEPVEFYKCNVLYFCNFIRLNVIAPGEYFYGFTNDM